MNDEKFLTPIFGMLTSLISWEVWQNFVLSFLVAFIGGIAAFLARKLCSVIWSKFFPDKNFTDETKN